ncbi:MAG: hypothetical protein AABP62_09105 [Planctomycetota bacterium]
MESHRKRKVVYNDPGHAHFLTFSCQQRLPLLSKDRPRQWVVHALQDAREKLDFLIWGYVVMPEHVHLLICPRRREYKMGHIEAAIKRPVSARAKQFLIETEATDWLRRLTVREGDEAAFRFWLPGGGYDENIWNERPIPEILDYIHMNPVRRGLVEHPIDWAWSSARFWAGDRGVPLLMDPIDV